MQMRFSTYRLLACMAVVVLAGLPRVAAADEWDSCVKLSDDLAVAGCSRAIDSHQYTGRSLARLYARRGGAGGGRQAWGWAPPCPACAWTGGRSRHPRPSAAGHAGRLVCARAPAQAASSYSAATHLTGAL